MRGAMKLFALGAVFVLGACSSTTTLDVDSTEEFPRPLVVPVQAHMGLYIPPAFKNYVYDEYKQKKKKTATRSDGSVFKEDKSKAGAKKPGEDPKDDAKLTFRVNLGDAQTRMVESVFPPVFSEWTMLESLDRSAMPREMDLFIVPNISKVQYTTPTSSRAPV